MFCSQNCLLYMPFKDIFHFLFYKVIYQVLCLKSFIHLDLSFMQGDIDLFAFFCANNQLDSHHFLNMLSYFPLYGFGFFDENQVSMIVEGYFWFLDSITWMKLSGSIPIPCSSYQSLLFQRKTLGQWS